MKLPTPSISRKNHEMFLEAKKEIEAAIAAHAAMLKIKITPKSLRSGTKTTDLKRLLSHALYDIRKADGFMGAGERLPTILEAAQAAAYLSNAEGIAIAFGIYAYEE